jgi:Flp pilus assembly protein TadD
MSSSDDHRREGNTALAAGDFARAEECYRRATAEHPGSPDAHTALGFALLRQGRLAEAQAPLERALSLAPRDPDVHFLLGSVARRQHALDAAAAHLRTALELRPDFAEAHPELGIVLRFQRRLDEAMRCSDQALSLQPEFDAPRLNKGLVHLLRGEFAPGLELYENRLREPAERVAKLLAILAARGISRWRGEMLRGKRLLVWIDEGAGDFLMHMRYLPMLAAKGGPAIIVLSDPSLARVARTFPNVAQVATFVDELPLDAIDAHCPVVSLPYAFGTRADTIPAAVPYLEVPPSLRSRWAKALSGLRRPRVGVVWAGNLEYGRDALRSIAPQRLRPLLDHPRCSFVSLQKGASAQQLEALGAPVFAPVGESEDFLDTAAIIAELDLVVGVDTSVVHLTGSLGKPVWVMNRFESEWRWQVGREDSPWYPTLRLFNQPAPGDWDSVVRRVAGELSLLA